jgi:uncharacterized protein YprB with RNaseH-like and TPR domain
MLNHTFIHLPGIGPATERALWEAGAATWQEFMEVSSVPPRVRGRRADLSRRLEFCQERLEALDGVFFGQSLPSGEHWRLYAEFRDRAAFLDIETTGLSPAYSYITMVGILDSRGYTPYVRGENIEDLRAALERYVLFVTYNGSQFDLPYVEHFFGPVFRRAAHLDLRFPLRRLGYGGGLKSIERRLRVARSSGLAGLDGYDAVLLWRMWEGGDRGARDTLVRYNAEDVASLPALAEIVYNQMLSGLSAPRSPLQQWERPLIDLPYDPDAIGRLHSSRGYRWA